MGEDGVLAEYLQKIMPIVQQNKGLETAVSKEIPDFYLDKLNF